MINNFTFLLASIFFVLGLGKIKAQDELEYRRSSLTLVLIEDDFGDSKDMIVSSYESYPFPDKYNLHQIEDKRFIPSSLILTEDDYKIGGFYLDTLKTFKDFMVALKKPLNTVRYITADSSMAVLEPNEKEILQMQIDKYIREKKLAKQIVSTWFNRSSDGQMDWSVIQERGMYSASAEKLDDAKTVALKTDYLMDWDLIGNTYTIFNKLEFYPNEPVAALVRETAKSKAIEKFEGKPEVLLNKALEGIEKVYEKTKEGYTVKCTSFLYQLEWNEEVAEKVKNHLFNNNISLSDRNVFWDTTNIFKMNLVGKLTSSSLVTFKIGETRTEEQIINLQLIRTMDNALAKLQKKYVQFRPVSPINSVQPVTARIGLKEGVEPGQKYEILELVFDKNNNPTYKTVGKVKVDKKLPIWDNRHGADLDPLLDEEGNIIRTPEFTTFKGGKKAQPGLNYIRLLK